MKLVIRLAVLFSVFQLSACWLGPKKIDFSDQRLNPFFSAIAKVDRASMGFTPIQNDAEIRLELSKGNYDAMLHIYGRTSRTIAFKRVNSDYEWIGEQETHSGPKKYTTVDGTFNEKIVLTHHLLPISGFPIGKTVIRYHGDDPSLSRRDLTLNYILPIISGWDASKRNIQR